MKKLFLMIISALSAVSTLASPSASSHEPEQGQRLELRFIETSDVHGCFFPVDLVTGEPRMGSMARVSSFVKQLRQQYGDRLIVLDNGDILQGQPVSYFSNYLDTLASNVAASVINFMDYDAQSLGNHDVETGHKVFDKWIGEVDCPSLGANVVDEKTGLPYVSPYLLLNRGGVKVAVLGLITPAIPNWLSPKIWEGLKFQEMVSSARYWVDFLKRNERPDVIVGLFHSGYQGGISTPEYDENAARKVAQQVEGFDIIFMGHDHKRRCEYETAPGGKQVLLIDPANNAMAVGDATVKLEFDGKKWNLTEKTGQLSDVTACEIDRDFMEHFQPYIDRAKQWIQQPIGEMSKTITTRDCFFGNSAFNDLVLNMELDITHADVAFSAPLATDIEMRKGKITMGDMFSLYKFENQLYVMKLTGDEIRKHLEMSYAMWITTMKSPRDHMILMKESTRGDQPGLWFAKPTYNFDSAAGIDYEVDVTKPEGGRVKILRMSSGEPFDPSRFYTVAMNSYRANGGGELLTRGAGIAHDELESRIVQKSEYDLRYYLTQEIKRKGIVNPKPNHNWRFVPEKWVKQAAARDFKTLFE